MVLINDRVSISCTCVICGIPVEAVGAGEYSDACILKTIDT